MYTLSLHDLVKMLIITGSYWFFLTGCELYNEFRASYIQDREITLSSGQTEDELRNGSDYVMGMLPDIDGVLMARYSLDSGEFWGRCDANMTYNELIASFQSCGWQEKSELNSTSLPLSPNRFKETRNISWWKTIDTDDSNGSFLTRSTLTVCIPRSGKVFYLWE